MRRWPIRMHHYKTLIYTTDIHVRYPRIRSPQQCSRSPLELMIPVLLDRPSAIRFRSRLLSSAITIVTAAIVTRSIVTGPIISCTAAALSAAPVPSRLFPRSTVVFAPFRNICVVGGSQRVIVSSTSADRVVVSARCIRQVLSSFVRLG
jgi:hypothetical protein